MPPGSHTSFGVSGRFVKKCVTFKVFNNFLRQPFSPRSATFIAAGVLLCAAQAQAFSLDDVIVRAKALVDAPYVAPLSNLPPAFSAMQFGDYVKIQPRSDKFEWRDQKTPFKLGFYHQGMQFDTPVVVHEIVDSRVDPIPYDPDQFYFGDHAFDRSITSKLGYAGFKVLYPVNSADKEDEIMSVLGASYFRVIGKGQVYGLSARGLAIDTAEPTGEEFPRFTEFWVQRPSPCDKHLTFYALLNSPRATGAYQFVLTPGVDAILDVRSRVFMRGDVTRLGVAPLTSMFLFGPNQQSNKRNFRPAIHDSNGLAIHTSEGEWIWRPLNDPQNVEVSSFPVVHPKGFGLLQRGREFGNFQDLKDRYDLRPSAWIEPQGDWGRGAVQLVEIPTADETNDNIVAYWSPAELPPKGTPLAFDYRIHWTTDEAALIENDVGWVQQTFHTTGELTQSNLIRYSDGTTALLVDFTGPVLAKLPLDAPVTPQVSVDDNAELISTQLQPNPAIKGWRLTLRLKVKNITQRVEMNAALTSSGRTLTETWHYQLPPHSDVQRSF